MLFFSDKLNNLMTELGINQTTLHNLTGIGKPSISQYLAGKHEPSNERKRQIARALGVADTYFDQILPDAKIVTDEVINLPTAQVARMMHKSKEFVEEGPQHGCFPWGYGVKMKRWSYWVSNVKFREYTGIGEINEVINLPTSLVAKLMNKSKEYIEEGLQQGCFPWGYAVPMRQWSYWISSVKFTEYTGIKVPLNIDTFENSEGSHT